MRRLGRMGVPMVGHVARASSSAGWGELGDDLDSALGPPPPPPPLTRAPPPAAKNRWKPASQAGPSPPGEPAATVAAPPSEASKEEPPKPSAAASLAPPSLPEIAERAGRTLRTVPLLVDFDTEDAPRRLSSTPGAQLRHAEAEDYVALLRQLAACNRSTLRPMVRRLVRERRAILKLRKEFRDEVAAFRKERAALVDALRKVSEATAAGGVVKKKRKAKAPARARTPQELAGEYSNVKNLSVTERLPLE